MNNQNKTIDLNNTKDWYSLENTNSESESETNKTNDNEENKEYGEMYKKYIKKEINKIEEEIKEEDVITPFLKKEIEDTVMLNPNLDENQILNLINEKANSYILSLIKDFIKKYREPKPEQENTTKTTINQ